MIVWDISNKYSWEYVLELILEFCTHFYELLIVSSMVCEQTYI